MVIYERIFDWSVTNYIRKIGEEREKVIKVEINIIKEKKINSCYIKMNTH